MSYLFDTHCHLVDLSLDEQLSLTSESLSIIAVSKSQSDWLETLELSKRSKRIHPAVGIHPWFLRVADFKQDLADLEILIQQNRNVQIIGEVGLDFSEAYRDSIDAQIECLDFQLNLSATHDLALSLHCYKAFEPLLKLLSKHQIKKAVMHGFSGSYEQAKSFVRQGYKLGIGPLLLNDNAIKLRKVVEMAPIEFLVLESDAPYAKQGRDLSHQDRLLAVAQCIAHIKQISVEEVVKTTYDSAQSIFGLKS